MQERLKYGFWTIPVGKVKRAQAIEEGLREEIMEECNLRIGRFKEMRFKRYVYKRRGRRVVVQIHLFEVYRYDGVPRNNEPQKHARQLFMPIGKIRKLPYLSDVTLLYLATQGFRRKAHLVS